MALDAGLTSEARSALVVASTVLPQGRRTRRPPDPEGRPGQPVVDAGLGAAAARGDRQRRRAGRAVADLGSRARGLRRDRRVLVRRRAPAHRPARPRPRAVPSATSSHPPVSSAGPARRRAPCRRRPRLRCRRHRRPRSRRLRPRPIPPTPTAPTPPTARPCRAPRRPRPLPTTERAVVTRSVNRRLDRAEHGRQPVGPVHHRSSATQEVTAGRADRHHGVPTAGQDGEQSVDPAQQVQQAPATVRTRLSGTAESAGRLLDALAQHGDEPCGIAIDGHRTAGRSVPQPGVEVGRRGADGERRTAVGHAPSAWARRGIRFPTPGRPRRTGRPAPTIAARCRWCGAHRSGRRWSRSPRAAPRRT